jgi:hypothetical protein
VSVSPKKNVLFRLQIETAFRFPDDVQISVEDFQACDRRIRVRHEKRNADVSKQRFLKDLLDGSLIAFFHVSPVRMRIDYRIWQTDRYIFQIEILLSIFFAVA